MQKNIASQKIVVFAFGTSTGLPVTGDALNITANLRIDGGSANPVDDTNPTELEYGYYVFDLSQAETNGDYILISPVSSTSNTQVIGVPGAVYTRPPNFNTMGIESDGDLTQVNNCVSNTDMRGTESAATATGLATHDEKLDTADANIDTLLARLTADRAGYLDELAAANIPTDLANIEADTQNIQGRIPAALLGGRIDANVGAISEDATAANNLELDYDGTGYAKANSTIGTTTTNTDMRGTDAAATSTGLTAHDAKLDTADANIDTLLTRLTADRAGYLDELAAANIPTDLANIEADTQNIQGRIPAALLGGRIDANVGAISEDATAANNLELDYDGTGYDKANSTIGTTTVNTDMRGTDSAATASALTTHDGKLDTADANIDTLLTRLTADRAGYLDELAAANIPTDLANIEADTQNIQGRIPAALLGGRIDANVGAISEDATAANNLELDYDGTGYDKANSTIGTTTVNTDMRGTDSAATASALTTHDGKLDTADANIDTLMVRLSAARAGYLDELAAANIPTDLANIETDTQNIQGRIPAALLGGRIDSNVGAISEDATAANNLELDYDGTGYDKANSTIGTATVNTDMRGTDSAALATGLATHDGKLDTVDGIVDSILVDTTAIKAKTDNLPSGITKNVALSDFVFYMTRSTDHITAATGVVPAVLISLDGAAFSAATNTPATEISNGAYKIDFTQAEMNANVVSIVITAAGADQRVITILTV